MAEKYWKLGIVGWPLGYSLSPLMHTAALKAAGLKGEYKEYPVKPEDLEKWLTAEAPKLDGFNVTMPHKKMVFGWINENGGSFGELAIWDRRILAVNTVKLVGGRMVGYDTDGEGFLRPLLDRAWDCSRGNVLLLGAGGAADAIADALNRRGSRIMVWNRHSDRAESFVNARVSVHGSGRTEAVKDLNGLSVGQCNLLVNATPAGMKGEPDLPVDVRQLHKGQIVYDIVYQPRETPLIQAARKHCEVITGDEMLAAQGASSFKIWTDVDGMYPVMHKVLDEYYAGKR